MEVGMQATQGIRQEQVLSQKLLASVNILQKNSQELESFIMNEVETNPLLEMDESIPDNVVSESAAEPDGASSDALSGDPEEMDFSTGRLSSALESDSAFLDGEFDGDAGGISSRLEDGSYGDEMKSSSVDGVSSNPDKEWDRPLKDRGESIQDCLERQLQQWNGTATLMGQLSDAGCTEERFRELVRYLIDNVDDDGFIRSADDGTMLKVSMMGDPLNLEMERYIRGDVGESEVSLPVLEALHVLQGFDPRGIGARNLQESFVIQARALPDFPEIALVILKEHFDDLMNKRYAVIGRKLKVSEAVVQSVVESVRRLVPHPGRLISGERPLMKNPDLRIVKRDGKYVAESTASATGTFRRLRVSKMYSDMLNDKSLGKSDRAWISEKKKSAEEFLQNVHNRFVTMENVMNAIIAKQPDYFRKGGSGVLKPMILQDIADALKLSVSTVSRATSGKYVETPRGIMELKEFFSTASSAVVDSNGEEVGVSRILEAIRALVDAEDKRKPLSDDKIAAALKEKGFPVARRTVAKYREEKLNILKAQLRRQL